MISFHVILLVCSMMNGACQEAERFGPYLGASQHGQINPAACFMQGQLALAESEKWSAWVAGLDARVQKGIASSATLLRSRASSY